MQIRALVGARVSVVKDADTKTSHHAQLELGTADVKQRGWDVVGTFTDLDVSATIQPFDRPDLGPWLTDERLHEWDAIAWSKVDRAFRSMIHCVEFVIWAKKHRKIVVFAEDKLTLDYRNPDDGSFESLMANFFLLIAGFFAEIELNRFRTRAKNSHAQIRKTKRWPGGVPPYGFMPIDNPDGGGRILIHNPDEVKVITLAGDLMLSGMSANEVAKRLTDAGYPTRRMDRSKGTKKSWSGSTVLSFLTNPATQGLKVGKDRRLVRGDDGLPIRMSNPIFPSHDWERIQQAIEGRKKTKSRSYGASPMLGLLFCTCGKPAYRHPKPTCDYYRCRENCSLTRSDVIFSALDVSVKKELANIKVKHKVFIPGEDHSEELDRVKKSMSEIREEKDMGLYDYDEGESEYKERLASLARQRRNLEALPYRPSRWEEVETRETYAEAYERMDRMQRRQLLIDGGFRFIVGPKVDGVQTFALVRGKPQPLPAS